MTEYQPPRPAVRRIVDLNRDRYRELVASKGWGTQQEQALALGVSQATISRVLECGQAPGQYFIGALIFAFPDEVKNLFVSVEDATLRRSA
ncbi:hypothetical protein ACFY4C_20275 [Actinomadura viridis]|uniref:hypothetical protein n=1 Tax=Actinomadura viridis TaxID=58110 RepID=UPI0036AFBFF3